MADFQRFSGTESEVIELTNILHPDCTYPDFCVRENACKFIQYIVYSKSENDF